MAVSCWDNGMQKYFDPTFSPKVLNLKIMHDRMEMSEGRSMSKGRFPSIT